MTMLSLRNVSYAYAGAASDAVHDVTLHADRPEVIAIAGPNGAGKSTLLDLIAGQKIPKQGACEYAGRDIRVMSRQEVCRFASHVPQQVPGDIPYTVEDVVLTGRTPYGRGLYENEGDRKAADEAMRIVRIDASFRNRRFSELSGGEKQRVLLAAAVCQQAKILLLDEPGAHLDPANESWLWILLRDLSASGCLVIVVTHHLPLAAQHSDRVWLMHKGRLVADAAPSEAMRPERLTEVFEVPFYRQQDDSGRMFLTYGF